VQITQPTSIGSGTRAHARVSNVATLQTPVSTSLILGLVDCSLMLRFQSKPRPHLQKDGYCSTYWRATSVHSLISAPIAWPSQCRIYAKADIAAAAQPAGSGGHARVEGASRVHSFDRA